MDNFKENIILAPYTNYKIGGPARYFNEAKNIKELKSALQDANKFNLPVFILGAGCNLLVSDAGFNGAVICLRDFSLDGGQKYRIDKEKIFASSGALVNDLVVAAFNDSLSGLEWAGGLPGTLGGAIRGNAGCFGKETKDIILEITSILKNQPFSVIKRSNKDCGFEYRGSIFKKNNEEIILEATINLQKGDKARIGEVVKNNVNYRLNNHPMEYPSVGSVFKNAPFDLISGELKNYFKQWLKTDPFLAVPAGIIIKEAGLAGHSIGGAKVSEKHSNFIVNTGNATAKDVKSLIDLIKNTVKEKFNLNLEEEMVYLGEF